MGYKGICRLCESAAELRLSHVLPALLFKWLRKTSATGHIRRGEAPNRRVQDGWRHYWLCSSCEQMNGESEKLFADQYFYPLVNDQADRLHYGPWLLKFCVSISWRALLLYRERDAFEDYSRAELELLGRAERVWRDFLLGKSAEFAEYGQHRFVVKGVSKANAGTAANINRHVLRSVAIDVLLGPEQIIVYTQIPRLFLMGVIRDRRPEDWRGTVINAEGGTTPPKQGVPSAFYNYVSDKANHAGFLLNSISDQQRAKIQEAVESDPRRVWQSDTQRAIELDLERRFPEDRT